MRIEQYYPAKNLVLLQEVKVAEKGNIMLINPKGAGYFKVVKIGPLCERTKVGDYVVSTAQFATEITFKEGVYMQLPEVSIDGYYTPTEEELKSPEPVFKETKTEDDDSFKVIDSEGGNNELGSEFGIREDSEKIL